MSVEGAEVTAFSEFCHCPEPQLDDNDVCELCGTEWKERE